MLDWLSEQEEAAKEEISYILKQVGGKGRRQARSVASEPRGKDSPGQLSRIVEYQDPSMQRQKGLGSGHPGELRGMCL